jgi:hypothetical protein
VNHVNAGISYIAVERASAGTGQEVNRELGRWKTCGECHQLALGSSPNEPRDDVANPERSRSSHD